MSGWVFGLVMFLAGACASMLVAAATRSARRSRARARLGVRADLNGQRLLSLADELERHAALLDRLGMPMHEPRAWARLCRSVAVDHLACINVLLLEPDRPGPADRHDLPQTGLAGVRGQEARRHLGRYATEP
ncbi:hypothetical protein [Luteimonas huabeiensis]|uniref:hypothetical protein n=1 Tax=Luteimonas huabeiensis TaxID=1244513 RepID=UPI0004651D50|nr:hypothetical protein [Luteimonas huabeiensis]